MTAFGWAILTACIWGIVPILEKFGLTKVEPFTALFYRCFGVVMGIVLLSLFIVKPQEIKSVDLKSAVVLVIAGFLASFVANITFYHALKIGEVSKVVPVAGTYQLIAVILGIFLFREAITIPKIAGVVLVFTGLWFLR